MPSAYPALICALDPRLPRLSPTSLKSYLIDKLYSRKHQTFALCMTGCQTELRLKRRAPRLLAALQPPRAVHSGSVGVRIRVSTTNAALARLQLYGVWAGGRKVLQLKNRSLSRNGG